MPGIAGIVSKRLTGEEFHQLEIMLDSMMHEPFYTRKIYQHDDLGVYAGIIAIEGDSSDHMPVFSNAHNKALLFWGECCPNHHDLLELYEQHGSDFMARLNGWFSALMIDIPLHRIILFNDRYGAYARVYISETEDAWYFASEAKALLAVLPDCRSVDMAALGEYFLCDCALENKTYFRNISLLPCGSVWIFANGTLTKRTYFDPAEWEAQPSLEFEPFYDAFRAVFQQAVSRCFEGTRSVGMSLTGGLDTRMIMAARQPAPGELPCYTFGGVYRESFDVILARQVADVFKQPWQVLTINREYLDNFATHATRSILLTDGLASVDGSDELYLQHLAREIAPVRLTGKHGSEIVGCHPLLRKHPLQEDLFDDEFKPFMAQANRVFDTIKAQSPNPLSFVLFKELPWYWIRGSAAELTQLTVRSPFLDNDLSKLMYQFPQQGFTRDNFKLRFVHDADPRLFQLRTNQGMGGNVPPHAQYLSQLSYRFFTTGDKLFYSAKTPHWFSRVDTFLTRAHVNWLFIGRQYFRHYRKWFRDELSDYVKDVLLDPITLQRPYWNGKILRQMVEAHTAGRANYFTAIRKALTVELIHRILLDRPVYIRK